MSISVIHCTRERHMSTQTLPIAAGS